MNPTCPVLSELANFLRLVSAPASCDEFGFKAVNRRVACLNLARGAKSRFLNPLENARGFGFLENGIQVGGETG